MPVPVSFKSCPGSCRRWDVSFEVIPPSIWVIVSWPFCGWWFLNTFCGGHWWTNHWSTFEDIIIPVPIILMAIWWFSEGKNGHVNAHEVSPSFSIILFRSKAHLQPRNKKGGLNEPAVTNRVEEIIKEFSGRQPVSQPLLSLRVMWFGPEILRRSKNVEGGSAWNLWESHSKTSISLHVAFVRGQKAREAQTLPCWIWWTSSHEIRWRRRCIVALLQRKRNDMEW